MRCVCDHATTTATGTATSTRPTDAPNTVCLLLKASVMMMMMIDAMALLIVLMHAALPRFASSVTLTRENFVRAGAHPDRARRDFQRLRDARSKKPQNPDFMMSPSLMPASLRAYVNCARAQQDEEAGRDPPEPRTLRSGRTSAMACVHERLRRGEPCAVQHSACDIVHVA